MKKNIIVGVSPFEPLVIESKNKYDGFEIQLWEIIANKLDINFVYKSYEFKNLIIAIKNKEIDLAIAGITRTKKREEDVSFSYFTMRSGLSILLSKRSKLGLFSILNSFVVKNFKKIAQFLFIFLSFIFLVSNLFWFFEKGSQNIRDSYSAGIIDSLWWTVTIMGGVGGFYPDYPISRAIGFFVVFFGITFFAIFIAKITSFIAIDSLKYIINEAKDLKDKKVATKSGTTSVDELERVGAKINQEKNIYLAFNKLVKGSVDAVVFDEPVIRNFVKNQDDDNFAIVGETFDKQTYGFAFQHNSKIRESVNRELLGLFESGEYDVLYKKWFGN